MIKRLKKYPTLVITILLAVLLIIIFSPFLIDSSAAFFYGMDTRSQYYPFYTEFRNLMINSISNRTLPFYSWSLFLGSNFWASKSYYILGDIYNYITLLSKAMYPDILLFQTMLRIFVSGISFYFYAKIFNYKPKTTIILAVLYAFSSWVIVYIGQPMFLSFYSFAPLYLLGIEKYLRENKKILFILMTTILILTNYYLFYSISLFTVFYFIYRYYLLHHSFQGFIRSCLIAIAYYIVGVLMSMFLILPTVYFMTTSSRIGEFSFQLTHTSIESYFNLIQSFFVPNQFIINQTGNLFSTGEYNIDELCLWAGSISVLLVPQFLIDKEKKYRNATKLFYLILFLFLIIPSGNMIFHGFSQWSYRWVFLIVIVNLITAGRYLDKLEEVNKKVLLFTFLIMVNITILSIPIYFTLTNQWNLLSEYKDYCLINISSAIFLSIFFFLLYFSKKEKQYYFILGITLIELISRGFYPIYQAYKVSLDKNYVYRISKVLEYSKGGFQNYLTELESSNSYEYYRIYANFETIYQYFSMNTNLLNQIKGLMTYDTTYSYSIDAMNQLTAISYGFSWMINIKHPQLIDYLNVKYAVVLDESELPHDNFSLVVEGYLDTYKIYYNENYQQLGFTVSNVITYSEYVNTYGEDLSYLFSVAVVETEREVEEIEMHLSTSRTAIMELLEYRNNYLVSTIQSDGDSFLIINIPYDKGWSVLVNGKSVDTYAVNGGMIGFPVYTGENQITLSFMPDGFQLGVILSIIGVVCYGTIIVIEVRRRGKRDEKTAKEIS